MKNIKSKYKLRPTTTNELIKDYGFSWYLGECVYRFPVYKYSGKPLVFCNMVFDEEENVLLINVFEQNLNTFYSYNKPEYGVSDVVEHINKIIYNKIRRFMKLGLIKKERTHN